MVKLGVDDSWMVQSRFVDFECYDSYSKHRHCQSYAEMNVLAEIFPARDLVPEGHR